MEWTELAQNRKPCGLCETKLNIMAVIKEEYLDWLIKVCTLLLITYINIC
jgi:hypothetical protein